MSTNPYQTPSDPFDVAVTPREPGIEGAPYASQNKRLGNFLIDLVVIIVLNNVAGFVFGFIYGMMAAANGRQITQDELAVLNIYAFILSIIVDLIYLVVMESCFAATIGKFITKTRVVSAEGGTASFGQIVGRSICRYIPFEPVSFLVGDNTTGWHDSLSGTRVVDISRAR